VTELSWLLDLLLNHKLPTKAKEHVVLRLNDLASRMTHGPIQVSPVQMPGPAIVNGAMQSPSFMASMAKHETGPTLALEPAMVAATPATAIAMESRQQAIRQAQLGKPEPGRTSPRKF
jgi:hypothetical protein